MSNLKSWRDVIEPNEDVARGNYRQSEFAADLAAVANGGGTAEYSNPAEFFSRTYLTVGLKELLVKTLKRLTSGNGEPVIQLKTSFGGGKTHSLLALYHLFGGKIRAEQSSAVREILNAAHMDFLPRVHTATVVGTWTNPLKTTFWGEIAAQLSRATGKPELYELVRENDEQKISPGAGVLKQLFDEASPCLILIDEIVAYGRKLNKGEVDGGTFGNLMSFIQELTEAAKASKNCAVVVSIPESDAEVVDDLGREVLKKVEKYFGRIEFVWTPVGVVEGYEIVRRRLFKPCRDTKAREETCAAFFGMYVNNPNDFPNESRQNSYREKLLSCYPIHPKLFDYLYDKWTSLEGFQKTRGVLRLMANVIYRLWYQNDQSAMIMPGNIPLDFDPVRSELTKLLGGNWETIINSEIDGEKSKALELDKKSSRFGRFAAARKMARTIFMGTAPSSRLSDVRGIEEIEIHLGTIQPQDLENIGTFNDALNKLKENLYYLYSRGTRLWFGVNPTLRKFVEDKSNQFPEDDIDFEIEKRLAKWQGKNLFRGVHFSPKKSEDIADEQKTRLVILPPQFPYDDGKENNSATEFARKILDTRGTIPRSHKNMLLFMAADTKNLEILKKTVREYKAWQAVIADKLVLNLDALQLEDAKSKLAEAEKNFAMKISQAYSKIFAPDNRENTDMKNWEWKIDKLTCTTEDNLSAAAEKFFATEMMLGGLGVGNLKNLLDKNIWRESESVKLERLWESFTRYYYMPRLVDVNVLLETVRKGVASKTFALAENENLDELKFGDIALGQISMENFLVKASVAEKKLKIDEPPPETPTVPADSEGGSEEETSPPEEEPLPKRFSMNISLDKTRIVKEINKCNSEILSQLINLPNAEVSIHLSVKISVPDGISSETKEIVAANCNELRIDNFHFEP